MGRRKSKRKSLGKKRLTVPVLIKTKIQVCLKVLQKKKKMTKRIGILNLVQVPSTRAVIETEISTKVQTKRLAVLGTLQSLEDIPGHRPRKDQKKVETKRGKKMKVQKKRRKRRKKIERKKMIRRLKKS